MSQVCSLENPSIILFKKFSRHLLVTLYSIHAFLITYKRITNFLKNPINLVEKVSYSLAVIMSLSYFFVCRVKSRKDFAVSFGGIAKLNGGWNGGTFGFGHALIPNKALSIASFCWGKARKGGNLPLEGMMKDCFMTMLWVWNTLLMDISTLLGRFCV